MSDRRSAWFWLLAALMPALSLSACGLLSEQASPTAGSLFFFDDDFSDPASGWLEVSDAEAAQGYRDGKFFFRVQALDMFVWDNPGLNLQDFTLEVEARQLSGGADNSYGVMVRYVDDGNFYRFDLSGDSYYAVSKLENQEWITLADWQTSPHIKPQGEVNLLKIVCKGSQMTFQVNGQKLVAVEDDSFERGDVGLFAGTFSDPSIEVEFDNLKIQELE